MTMKNLLPILALVALPLFGDDPHAGCPMHAQHVDERGDQVMGFSHEKTKHTFATDAAGGAIEVRANAADDAESIAMIRTHLQQIAKDFASGDFAKPVAIHGRMPDGAAKMKALAAKIDYRYEELETGARVRISSDDERARDAVHAFLRFQRTEHRTE
jgi:hypothetical protein